MAITRGNSTVSTTSGSGVTSRATPAFNVSTGQAVIGFLKWENATEDITSVTDNVGNSYSLLTLRTQGGAISLRMFYALNVTGDANLVVTGNLSGGSDFVAIGATAYSGVAASSAIDDEDVTTGTAIAFTTPALTLADDHELLVACGAIFHSNTSGNAGSGFAYIAGASPAEGFYADRIAVSGGSQAFYGTFSGSADERIVAIAGFKAAASVTQDDAVFHNSTAPANGTTSVAPSYPPGTASGHLLIPWCATWRANLPSDPTGWTKQKQVTAGSGAAGADSGSRYLTVWTKTAAGSETGTESITKTTETGTGMLAGMLQLEKGGSLSWDIAAADGADTTTGTAWSVTAATDPGIAAGDLVVVISAINSDSPTAAPQEFTSPALAATGCTFGTPQGMSQVFIQNSGTTQGDDARVLVAVFKCTAGPSSAAPVFTATGSSAPANGFAGPAVFLRVRATSSGSTLELEATLSGSGDLAGTLTATRPLSATISGTGDLAGTLTATFQLAAGLSGAGDLAAVLDRTQELTASLTGAGDLAATLQRVIELAAGLAGTGDLTATLTRQADLTATLAGAGDLTGSLTRIAELAATLTATGSLSVALELEQAVALFVQSAPGFARYTPGMRFRGQTLVTKFRKRRNQ